MRPPRRASLISTLMEAVKGWRELRPEYSCLLLLSRQDLDDIEDENEQLKQENKTLLKVVGQLTR